MVLGFWTTLICLILGFPLAYHLARTQSRIKTMLYFFILSPLLVGVVIRCYGWMIILGPHNGLINNTLKQLNLIENSLPLMFNTFGVTVGLIHVFSALYDPAPSGIHPGG
ncbi:MAG: hypothetical protein CM1200mP20_10500 [Pseudomonadota bacterium]|nr:MAG: hypothetical protein CM1200mP20_10500 [Pseudomonadota bacterium]